MTVVTDAVEQAFMRLGMTVTENPIPFVAGTAFLTGAASRVQGQIAKFTKSTSAFATAVLPSLKTFEGGTPIVVLNLSAFTLSIYAYGDAAGNGETMNGGTAAAFGTNNSRLTIPSGQAGVFIPKAIPPVFGGGPTTNRTDWSAQAFNL